MATPPKAADRLDVITVGRCSVDLYGQQIGSRLEDVTSFAKSIGGCPSNIAIGTARLGLRSGLITRVGDGSEASAKGLQSGDIILEVAGDKVMAPSDVTKSIDGAKAKGRKAVLLRVKSGDQERFVALTLGKV